MQGQDTSVFSKVMGKVSNEFLTRLFSKQEIYQAFLGLIRSKPGAELIYDQGKNTWYIGGSWDALCLIRQQMIVLIDCVFTFGNVQLPSSANPHTQEQTSVPENQKFAGDPLIRQQIPLKQWNSSHVAAKLDQSLPEQQFCQDTNIQCQIPTNDLHQNLYNSPQRQIFQPFHNMNSLSSTSEFHANYPSTSFQGPSVVLGRDVRREGSASLSGTNANGSPHSTDSNASIIEKLDTLDSLKNSEFPEGYGFSTADLSTSLDFDSGDEEDHENIKACSEVEGNHISNQSMISAILDLSRKVDAVSVNETFLGMTNNGSTNVVSKENFMLHQQSNAPSSVVEQTSKSNSQKTTQIIKGQKTTSSNTCNICRKTFLNKSNMIRHTRSIHKMSNINQSAEITVASPARESSLNETAEVLPETNKQNNQFSKDSVQNRSCRFCHKVFSTRSNLYKHSRKCKQAHECITCHERFENHDLLCHHVFVAHSLFLCRMCDKVVDSEENYADHVNFCHPNYSLDTTDETSGESTSESSTRGRTLGLRNQPFVRSGSCMGAVGVGGGCSKPIRCHRPNPCLKCGKVFSTFSNLLKHIRVIHENARFPCNLCKRVFACKDGLKHHMDKIHNKITYKCDICSMEFENQLRLAKHLSLIHDQQSSIYNFQCELCGKTFLYKTNLKRHKKLEHEGLRYSCQRCMTSFRSKIQLNEHHRIVHLGLLLKCEACEKYFHTWTTLRDHERAAHGKHSPIVCVVCGKKFTRYPGLSYHLRKHHKRKYNVAGEITVHHMVEDKKVSASEKVDKKKKRNKSKSSSLLSPDTHLNFPVESAISSSTVSSPVKTSSLSQSDALQSVYISAEEGERFGNFAASIRTQNPNYCMPVSNTSSQVPSFYDQQFNTQEGMSLQKGPVDAQAPYKSTNLPVPTYIASLPYEPSKETYSPQYENISTNSAALYSDIQEATTLCLGDAITFYDDLTLLPEQQPQQQSPIQNSLISDEFIMFNN